MLVVVCDNFVLCLDLVCKLLLFGLNECWLDVLVLKFLPFAVCTQRLFAHSYLTVL